MRVFIVFVTFKAPGISGSYYAVRYVDSQWASRDHARNRKSELDDSLKMGKAPEYIVEILEGRVADAAVQSPEDPQESTKGAQGGQDV